jgi:starch synthase
VGGLADTVRDAGGAQDTGFIFDAATPQALARVVLRAVALHADRAAWRARMIVAMAEPLSWAQPAGDYLALYRRMMSKREVSPLR